MRKRPFGQYCGVARALDVVGERWALLIVRDLLVRPRRFTDLLEGLAGIPSNVLSTRLKELEEAGVVERQLAPAPDRGVVYTLTDDGRELDEVVRLVGRWGSRRLGDLRPDEIVTPESLTAALRSTFHEEDADGVTGTWEIRAGDIVVHAQVAGSALSADVGPAPQKPDAVITVHADEPTALKKLLAGELGVDEAVREHHVELIGPRRSLREFVSVFRI